jgi:hypothetical protein
VDCSWGFGLNQACEGGDFGQAIEWMVTKNDGWAVAENDWEYLGADGYCTPRKGVAKFKVSHSPSLFFFFLFSFFFFRTFYSRGRVARRLRVWRGAIWLFLSGISWVSVGCRANFVGSLWVRKACRAMFVGSLRLRAVLQD